MMTLLLTGCMVGPKYHAPTPSANATAPPVNYKESPTQFQDTDGWKVAQPQDAMLHGKWWEIYNDPELNALEEKLNIDNQNIKQFFENFHGGADADCAGAVAALSDGGGFPIVFGSAYVNQPVELSFGQPWPGGLDRIVAGQRFVGAGPVGQGAQCHS